MDDLVSMRLTPRQYVANLVKAVRGTPTVHDGAKLIELQVVAQKIVEKALVERINAPTWRQEQEHFAQGTLAAKAFRYYGLNPWVYASVFAIMSAYASVPLRFRRRVKSVGDDGEEKADWEAIEDDAVRRLLRRPNGYQSLYDLREETSAYLELVGTAYWELGRKEKGTPGAAPYGSTDKGRVVTMWPIRPDLVKPEGDDDDLISGYDFRGQKIGVKDAHLEPHEVVQFRYFHPTTDRIGMGSFEPAVTAVEGLLYAAKWDRNFWRNNARPDVILETDQGLGAAALDRLIGTFESRHLGADRNHRVAALSHGLKARILESAAKDVDFPAGRRLNREEAFACFGTVPAVVGLVDEARFKNVGEQLQLFWGNTMVPKLVKERSSLDRSFAPEIAAIIGADAEDVEAWHDTSEIKALQEDQDKRSARVRSEFQANVITRDEARVALSHEPDPENDGYFIDVASPFGVPAGIAAVSAAEGDDLELRVAAELREDAGDFRRTTGKGASIVVPFDPSAARRR